MEKTGTGVLAAVGFLGCAVLVSSAGCNTSRRLDGLRAVFPAGTAFRRINLAQSSESVRRVTVAERDGLVVGYAVAETVVSRSGPFTIRVVLSPEAVVKEVQITNYPGLRGGEVRRESFRRQFVGLGPADSLRVGRDVDAVTGATISSHAVARGVRRAVRLVRDVHRDRSARPAATRDTGRSTTP